MALADLVLTYWYSLDPTMICTLQVTPPTTTYVPGAGRSAHARARSTVQRSRQDF